MFTREKGYPSKLVTPSWRAKDSLGLKAIKQGNPTTWDNLIWSKGAIIQIFMILALVLVTSNIQYREEIWTINEVLRFKEQGQSKCTANISESNIIIN